MSLSLISKTELLKLFQEKFTVNQIAEKTKVDKKEDCYNCKGLEEFGKPISVQDRIDFIARTKNAT